jgi:polyisoprenoid-binding protein YceI
MLEKSRITVRVTLASADTGDGQRDDMLKSDSFFDSLAHPVAVFTARRISHRGGDRYTATGTLSLRGETRPVTLTFSLKIDSGRAVVRGTATLNRTEFGVGSGEYAATDQIPDQVAVSFSFTATAQTG